jgi:hypothetical protein
VDLINQVTITFGDEMQMGEGDDEDDAQGGDPDEAYKWILDAMSKSK